MNPFGEQKNLGLLFAFRARTRARKQMHMYTLERERERELKTKIENQKSFPTSERLRDLALSLDKVVRRRLTFKSNLKINRAIDSSKPCPTAMLL